LFESDAAVLLLDEPDNFLDVPAKLELEARIAASNKTIVLISHDRDLLAAAATTILMLDAPGTWTHGASYRTYPEARERRQALLGDRLEQ
jgi:ATPase subunit of ABC transporter with duplicated ATPase domains